MKIQVLGSGCPSCKKLNDMAIQIIQDLSIDANVEYLTGDDGTSRIVELGIMSSPVLVINSKPVMVGFTPDIKKIKRLIEKELR